MLLQWGGVTLLIQWERGNILVTVMMVTEGKR